MGQIENIKNRVRSIPEFSEKNYSIVGYVFAALMAQSEKPVENDTSMHIAS